MGTQFFKVGVCHMGFQSMVLGADFSLKKKGPGNNDLEKFVSWELISVKKNMKMHSFFLKNEMGVWVAYWLIAVRLELKQLMVNYWFSDNYLSVFQKLW